MTHITSSHPSFSNQSIFVYIPIIFLPWASIVMILNMTADVVIHRLGISGFTKPARRQNHDGRRAIHEFQLFWQMSQVYYYVCKNLCGPTSIPWIWTFRTDTLTREHAVYFLVVHIYFLMGYIRLSVWQYNTSVQQNHMFVGATK